MSSFLNFRIFPKVSIEGFWQPRIQGELTALDPGIQQGVLQLRLFVPLLSRFDVISASFWTRRTMRSSELLPHLCDYPLYHLSLLDAVPHLWPVDDFLFSFFFKDLYPEMLRPPQSPFSLFFKALDLFPKSL